MGHGVKKQSSVLSCQLASATRGEAALGPAPWNVKTRRWACLLGAALLLAVVARADTYYVVVAGLGGEPVYTQRYDSAAKTLAQLFSQGGAASHVTLLTDAAATGAALTTALQQVAAAAKPADDFVLVLIGHGTDDGVVYKFNLPGPDLDAPTLARLCDRIRCQRQLIVATSECSGGALAALARPGRRAVIAATRNGSEKNATVFARYFVQALQNPAADLDKNQAISGQEAFAFAQRQVADFYKSQKRIATEHASDAEPKLLASITLVRFGAAQQLYANPAKRTLLARREELERQIDALSYRKDAMTDDDYRTQMTALLVALANLDKEIAQ